MKHQDTQSRGKYKKQMMSLRISEGVDFDGDIAQDVRSYEHHKIANLHSIGDRVCGTFPPTGLGLHLLELREWIMIHMLVRTTVSTYKRAYAKNVRAELEVQRNRE
ncbi:hypothetical protein Tco_0455427 [Tanacetum coccineum]